MPLQAASPIILCSGMGGSDGLNPFAHFVLCPNAVLPVGVSFDQLADCRFLRRVVNPKHASQIFCGADRQQNARCLLLSESIEVSLSVRGTSGNYIVAVVPPHHIFRHSVFFKSSKFSLERCTQFMRPIALISGSIESGKLESKTSHKKGRALPDLDRHLGEEILNFKVLDLKVLDEAKPVQETLTRNQFNRSGRQETDHCQATIPNFSAGV